MLKNIINTVSHPVVSLAHALHKMDTGMKRKVCRRSATLVIGGIVALGGAYLAHYFAEHAESQIAKLVGDALGYSVHAMGVAPIIKVIAEFLSIEV